MADSKPLGFDRRSRRFTEVLSIFMVRVAAFGALLVLIDIKLTLTVYGQTMMIGSGFSADLKGAIITAILISGWTAVKEYWLGASAASAEAKIPLLTEEVPQPTKGKP